MPPRERMTQTDETWLPTRQTLLSRLKNWDDQSSWREFFNLYWRLIYGVNPVRCQQSRSLKARRRALRLGGLPGGEPLEQERPAHFTLPRG